MEFKAEINNVKLESKFDSKFELQQRICLDIETKLENLKDFELVSGQSEVIKSGEFTRMNIGDSSKIKKNFWNLTINEKNHFQGIRIKTAFLKNVDGIGAVAVFRVKLKFEQNFWDYLPTSISYPNITRIQLTVPQMDIHELK